MVIALSNLILLIPIGCVLAIMLSMTSSTVVRPRNDGIRVFVKIVLWQFLLLGMVGLLARSSWFSLLWLIFALGFLVQLWYWERGLARHILLLVIGSNCKSTSQLQRIVHYLKHEGRGYWRRLGRRFANAWQATGTWESALDQTRLARPVRVRFALANLPRQSNALRLNNQLAQVALEQNQVSQWLGRLLIVSLSFLVLMATGIKEELFVGLSLRSILSIADAQDYKTPAFEIWTTIVQWKLHIIIPSVVWLAISMLYLIKKIPFLARHRPVTWFLHGYYRSVVVEGLADGLESSPDLAVVCNRLALAVPVPSWSRRLKKASARVAEGQSIAKALSGSGVLKRKESATLALCRDAESLAWAMRELSHSLLQRTLNRTHVAIQLLTVGLTIVAAAFTTMYALSTFGALADVIEEQL